MGVLETVVGLAFATIGTFLYLGQLISVVDFRLAQRLGLQETTENVEPLVSRLEIMAARWDATVLWIPPIAGVLILLNHSLWPAVSLIAGGLYLDAGGREWAKIFGLQTQGVPVGSRRERAVIYGTFSFLIGAGLAGIVAGLSAVT
jgi:hypothetical protein